MSGKPKFVVFCGPTLSHAAAAKIVSADFRPPAQAGDVYKAAAGGARLIALIDGVFHSRAAVFHKEILWALSEGVHVVGASSMGALRAAELAPFGMVGIGRTFEHFASAVVTDDDEVAIAHLDAEGSWRATTDAMVNIRATLAAAVDANVISDEESSRFCQLAKSRFYADRRMVTVVDDALAAGDDAAGRLGAWFTSHGIVDQKRLDAISMLTWVAERMDQFDLPFAATFPFSKTAFWWVIRNRLDAVDPQALGAGEPDTRHTTAVLDEARLSTQYSVLEQRALAQSLAVQLASRTGVVFDAAAMSAASADILEARGVHDSDELRRWQSAHAADDRRLRELVFGEAYRSWAERTLARNVAVSLLDQLQLDPCFPAITARAVHKQRELNARGLLDLSDPIDLTNEELWSWWSTYGHVGDQPTQMSVQARRLGFANSALMRQAIINEYHYVTRCTPMTPSRIATGSLSEAVVDRSTSHLTDEQFVTVLSRLGDEVGVT